ncbi:MAG: hypothetical protein CME68_04110 [Halobacteriovoraceae bacterium]|nr:hypothetical protein [Halobacteriovoraceae bacterium]
MSILEQFFKLKGYKRISHGVIYNQHSVKQVTFWDESGKEYKIYDLPEGTVQGITCFKEENGSLVIIE